MKSMLFASLLGCAWLTFASPGPLVGSEAAYGDAVANDGPAVVGEKRALLDDEDAFGGDAVIEEPEPQSIAERAAPPRVRAVSFLDKFDDRTAPDVVGAPVGNYGALNYNSFSLVTSNDPTVLVSPPSKPNFILDTVVEQAMSGQPALSRPNSTVVSFSMKSICYSCFTNAANAAESCTIQLAGRRLASLGGDTVVQELIYNPTLLQTLEKAPFNCTTFPATFAGLDRVDVALISAPAGATVSGVGFDNVGYVAYLQS